MYVDKGTKSILNKFRLQLGKFYFKNIFKQYLPVPDLQLRLVKLLSIENILKTLYKVIV